MGCHTWFYVCLNNKQKELRQEYFNQIIDYNQKVLQLYKNTLDEDWKTEYKDYCTSDAKEYWKDKTLTECKESSEFEGWSDKSILFNIKLAQTKTWQEYRDFLINNYSSDVEGLTKKCHCLDDIIKLFPDYLTNKEGLEYKEGKVYIDACSEAADKYLSRKMHDLFRIHNYEAKNCYSVEDCIQRCAENNVILTDEELKELKEWYKEYPDTLIEFG